MIAFLHRLASRRHVHVCLYARITEDQLDGLIDAVAEAAHRLDEEVFCSGTLHDQPWGIYGMEVVGYRLDRVDAAALEYRVKDAAVDYLPRPTELRITTNPRCRCS